MLFLKINFDNDKIMKIKCIAIDDEPYALKQIADYIIKTPFLSLKAQCYNVFEAMDIINENEVDLIFIDINMPGMSGFDYVKTLNNKVGVVFTTAYSEYAVDSYKVNAIDYLLKPISYDDFLRAANKAKNVFSNQNIETSSEHFFLKSDGKFVKVDFQEVVFIESQSEYVKIYREEKTPIMVLMSMKDLENNLPENLFMRVHRSYIVNLFKIEAVERNRLIVNINHEIPVSDQYKEKVKKFIDKTFL